MADVEREQLVDPTRSPPQVGDHLQCQVHCCQKGDSKKEDCCHQMEVPEDPQ